MHLRQVRAVPANPNDSCSAYRVMWTTFATLFRGRIGEERASEIAGRDIIPFSKLSEQRRGKLVGLFLFLSINRPNVRDQQST